MVQMIKPVLLTTIAKEDLENISDWLAKEWSAKVLLIFSNYMKPRLGQ